MNTRVASIVAALTFAAVTVGLHVSFGAPIDFLVLETALGLLFVAAGWVAWRRRPDVRTGPLLLLSGVLWFASGYTPMPEPLLMVIGFAMLSIYDLPLAHLVLTFPAERLAGVRALAFAALALGYAGRFAGRLLLAPHPFTPFGSEAAFVPVESATNWLLAGAAVFVAIVVIARWTRAHALLRRVSWPLFGAGMLAMAISAFDASEYAIGSLWFETEGPLFDWAIYGARALIPVGFLIGTLRLLPRERLTVADVALQTGGTSVAALERGLGGALGDPELAVLRWSPAAAAYLDRDGRAVGLPSPDDRARAVTYIEDDGRPYAAVVHDAVLREERSIVAALQSAARQALRGEELRSGGRGRRQPADLPRGDVTLLFADIEGSTGHLQRLGLRYADVLEQHRSIIRGVLREHGGVEVESVGDEFFAAFNSPSDAVRAAIAIQRGLQSHSWADGVPIAVRIGLHRGNPTVSLGGYVGLDVHRAARIMSAANGGQVLASEQVAAVVADRAPQIRVRRLGPHTLRGLDEPIELALLDAADVPSPDLPIRAEPVAASRAT